MKIICAWCQKDMGEKLGGESDLITHSICPDCKEKVGERTESIKGKKIRDRKLEEGDKNSELKFR